MEDIDFEEELKKVEKKAEVVENIALDDATETFDWDMYLRAYLAWPTNLVYKLVNAMPEHFDKHRNLPFRMYAEKVLDKATPAEDPLYNFLTFQVMTPMLKGWNSGTAARDIFDVNRVLAYSAQVEFVPVEFNAVTYYWCSKVHYESLPLLPLSPYHCHLAESFVSVGPAGIKPRSYPTNLLNVVQTSAGTQWRGSSVFEILVNKSKTTCRTPAQLALFAGVNNIESAAIRLADFDPDQASNIKPLNAKLNSIFAKCTTEWVEFFAAIGRDVHDPISAPRMLASLYPGGKGFYGECNTITIWLTGPSTIKVRDPRHTYIEHTYIPYSMNEKWPAECVMYAVTPADVQLYQAITGKPPHALVLPLTQLMGTSKHLRKLSQLTTHVTMIIAFAETPLVIFTPAANGFNINSIESNLKSLETEIVRLALTNLKSKLGKKVVDHVVAYKIMPDKDYSPTKCAVTFAPWLSANQVAAVAHTYMSMVDIEKETMLPTTHATDLIINGKTVRKGVQEAGIVANYPRAMPPGITYYGQLIKAGQYYEVKDGTLNESNVVLPRPDIYNWNKVQQEEVAPRAKPTVIIARANPPPGPAPAQAGAQANAGPAPAQAGAQANAGPVPQTPQAPPPAGNQPMQPNFPQNPPPAQARVVREMSGQPEGAKQHARNLEQDAMDAQQKKNAAERPAGKMPPNKIPTGTKRQNI